MQEVLIDGGEFVLERLVEKLQYLRVTLHGSPLWIEHELSEGL
jgi:hypothetical protein